MAEIFSAVLPAGIFIYQILKVWYIAKVLGI